MRLIYCLLAAVVISFAASAQEDKGKEGAGKKRKSVSITNDGGIRIETAEEDMKGGLHMDKDTITNKKRIEKKFVFTYAAVDIGINTLQDNTDYTTTAAQGFLNVPAAMKNEQLFSLRTGKSWNVNVWPIIFKARFLKTSAQKMYISSGIGLQMYNFRFSKDISYLNNTNPEVYMDTVNFSKNKLGFTYLSVPVALTAKTRMGKDLWLVYGVGVTGGYRLSSWTKQISGPRGKVKNHDGFNFSDFNACLTGEIGIASYFRIYASYQVTSLHKTALDQHPFCIGLRFGGA